MTTSSIDFLKQEKIPAYLKWLMLISTLISLSGCRIWDMANFQWQNANSEPIWKTAAQQAVVPFQMLNEHILVNVRVNNNHDLVFVLDSGAAATVITETAATDLIGLPKDKPVSISGSGNGDDPTAYIVHDVDINVGEFAMKNLAIIYAPTSALPFDSVEETYFDGVLGADFFNCCLVEINHDRRALIISAPTAKNTKRYMDHHWQTLAIDVQGNTPYLTTNVTDSTAQKTAKVMLDTGSTGTLSLFAGKGDFALPKTTYTARTSGISGDTSNQVGVLNALEFGTHTFQSLPTYFRLKGSNPQSGSHGVLGNTVMQQFNMVFDFGQERIWIQPNKRFSNTIASDRSGLRLLPHAGGAIAKDIATGTGADALNIPHNSIVVSIDGEAITAQNFDTLKRQLSAQTTGHVRLCWIEAQVQTCGALNLKARL